MHVRIWEDGVSNAAVAGEQNQRQLRRALGQFVTGVAVATTANAEERVGMTINSFSSVSLNPPLVLWSLRTDASSAQRFLSSGHYAINVLSADQRELAGWFASRARDKFADVEFEPGLGGCPLLPACLAYFECRLEETIPCGDHLVLVGAIERAAHREGEPLLFASGAYGVPAELAS